MAVMLGVDIGGTKMALGLVGSDGHLLRAVHEEATRTEDQDAFVEGLVRALRSVLEGADEPPIGIGLGCAGTVDWGRGAVIESPNLPVSDLPLAGIVADALDLPVILDNDANVATWAEVRVGCARGLRHVVMLTLGTGVGAGWCWTAACTGAPTAAPASWATPSCRRRVTSAPAGGEAAWNATPRAPPWSGSPSGSPTKSPGVSPPPAARRGTGTTGAPPARGELEGEAIGRLAVAGDAGAVDAVREVARWLGLGLSNLANIFNPEMIVVGGGLSALGDLLLDPAREILQRTAIAPNKDEARVAAAELGADAGVVGAALVAWEELGGRR